MEKQLTDALCAIFNGLKLAPPLNRTQVQLKVNSDSKHGHFSTNLALQQSKNVEFSPLALAQKITSELNALDFIEKAEAAPPGFINIFVVEGINRKLIDIAIELADNFGRGEPKNQKILVEFVSANPTGPLHVGHGRGAVYGDSLARLLKFSGYLVETEYYVNDSGRQMDILVLSTLFRLQQLGSDQAEADCVATLYPARAYQGEYVFDIAKLVGQSDIHPNLDLYSLASRFENLDEEKELDAWIDLIKKQIGSPDYQRLRSIVLSFVLDGIKQDLADIGVHFDRWFSEQQLIDDKKIDSAIQQLTSRGHTFEAEGALWFKSTTFGDEKDRVLIRSDGNKTYFANDIAYHLDKSSRGYDQLINVWGADHHGYIPRMKAALAATGHEESQLKILLLQFAALFRGKEKISMSTRSGEFVTLNMLCQEVGAEATRFYYNLTRADQHLNFDLSLAMENSQDNPIFYVQYAHARIASIFTRLTERQLVWQPAEADLNLLSSEIEIQLLHHLRAFPETVQKASEKLAPPIICQFLRNVSASVHRYYNQSTILVEEDALRNARLSLLQAVGIVLKNGLKLLGVSAPDRMEHIKN